jgi:hypothetical protein
MEDIGHGGSAFMVQVAIAFPGCCLFYRFLAMLDAARVGYESAPVDKYSVTVISGRTWDRRDPRSNRFDCIHRKPQCDPVRSRTELGLLRPSLDADIGLIPD